MSVDPAEAVALGAAIHAGVLLGEVRPGCEVGCRWRRLGTRGGGRGLQNPCMQLLPPASGPPCLEPQPRLAIGARPALALHAALW